MTTPLAHDLATTREPVASLHTYYRNPRRGDVDAIRTSLVVNGQYKPIVANVGTYTGREREVLAGNHTLIAARDAGWVDLAVCWVNVDNDVAARIVAADNRTADKGGYDNETLVALLKDLPDVDGTGYSVDDLDDLAAALEEHDKRAAAGPGLPEALDGDEQADESLPGRSMQDYADGYTDRGERSMVLTFTLPEFDWAVTRLRDLADKYGVETNTDVVLNIISDVTGDSLP